MHGSRCYENERKHEVAIFENKQAWVSAKGYVITTLLTEHQDRKLLQNIENGTKRNYVSQKMLMVDDFT